MATYYWVFGCVIIFSNLNPPSQSVSLHALQNEWFPRLTASIELPDRPINP